MNKMIKLAVKVVLVVVTFFCSIATTGAVHAATASVNWTAVVNYADEYACNGLDCSNPAYQRIGGTDCTNFVSQALHAGGMPTDSSWSYDHSNNSYTKAWAAVGYFQDYFVNTKSLAIFERASSMSAQYTPAALGDVYMYNWGRGEGWSHLAIETGYGTFANYTDPATGKNYQSVTGGSGDHISQHTTDREFSPWNWGYWTETDPKVKNAMDTIIIHFNR